MQNRESHSPVRALGFPPPPGAEPAQQPAHPLDRRMASLEQAAGIEWCAECDAHHPLEEDATAKQLRLSGGGAVPQVTGSAGARPVVGPGAHGG